MLARTRANWTSSSKWWLQDAVFAVSHWLLTNMNTSRPCLREDAYGRPLSFPLRVNRTSKSRNALDKAVCEFKLPLRIDARALVDIIHCTGARVDYIGSMLA